MDTIYAISIGVGFFVVAYFAYNYGYSVSSKECQHEYEIYDKFIKTKMIDIFTKKEEIFLVQKCKKCGELRNYRVG